MKDARNMDDVLSKIEELRSFLKFSDEVFPFISQLFLFIQDIIPLMMKINYSIKESTNKLPSATKNIASVSQTTEMATHQVLDKLDSIVNKLQGLSSGLKAVENAGEKQDVIEDVQGDISDIIFALQFQDITSQQLEQANRILEAIYEKFSSLFSSMLLVKEKTNVGEEVLSAIDNEADSPAVVQERENFDKQTADKVRMHGISQADIDQLFK